MFRLLSQIKKYRAAYINWIIIVMNLALKKEVSGKMRDGATIPSASLVVQLKELVFNGMEPRYDEGQDKITFKYNGRDVSLKGVSRNGDICGVFVNEEYSFLNVDGKYVIDVGMNIGDSSIYFALNGAKKVIAYEPFKKVFMLAKENIDGMNLSDKIFAVNGGVGTENPNMIIPDLLETTDISMKESESGIKVPVYSLEDTIESCPSTEIMLKMDCEGCEYEVFSKFKSENLIKIKKIVMEYHHGYKSLKTMLEMNGFKCRVTKPKKVKTSHKSMHTIGYLFAERVE